MVKNKIVFIAIWVSLLLIFGNSVWIAFNHTETVTLTNGENGGSVIDDRGMVFYIRGQWLAEWTDGDGSALPLERDSFTGTSSGLSQVWNDSKEGLFSPENGAAAYYARLKTEGQRGVKALFIPSFNSTSRVFVNGVEVYSRGKAGDSHGSEIPELRAGIAFFEQNDDIVEIVIHSTNHHFFNGGSFYSGLEYGDPEDITRIRSLIRLILFTLILLVMGFTGYCAIRSAFTSGSKYHFFLAMGLALIMARVFLGNIFFFESAEVIKKLPWGIGIRLTSVLSYLSIPLFINFGYRYLEGVGDSRKAAFISQIAALAGVLAVLVIPGRYQIYFSPLEFLVLMFGVGFLIYLGIQGIQKKIRFAPLFLTASGFTFLFTAYAFIFYLGIVNNPLFLWMGIFISVPAAAVALVLRDIQFIKQTEGLENRLLKVTDSRDSILLRLSDESGETLDKVNNLTRTLLQGSLGPLNSDQLVTTTLVLSNNMMHQNLLNDTIDLVRLEEKELVIHKESVNLFSTVSLLIGSLQPVTMGLSVNIVNEIPREIPQVTADEKKLGQIFFTIFSFALENTSKGEIKINAEKEDENVRIWINVSGIESGREVDVLLSAVIAEAESKISKENMAALRFYLTRELVRLHGGELTAEQPDDGAVTFNFSLPIYIQMDSADEVIAEELAVHLDALQNLQPLLDDVESERDISILVASSDPANLQIIKSQLASMNYRIHPVLSGEETLKIAADECPDMVVIDSVLNDYSCFEICRALRNEYTSDELPILLIIGDATDVMESLTSGASDYLRKPYQQEEFLTRVNTHLQLSKINSVYNQFVPREFLKALGQENIIDLKLGDQVQREMTILFVDIRAFTNLSENMTPQENFKFINSYLSQFTPIITRNNGFVDKFIGDAIMALYPDKPEDAIRTAIEMTEYVKIYNGYRANCGYDPINIGVGIHTGNLILGIVGDSQRMQGTVISDAVNLASRIQDVTKLYKSNVVISQETFVKLENPTEFFFRFLGKVKVKGKDKSVSLFEIYNADDEEIKTLKEETKGEFETAILLFAKRDFQEAAELFEKVLAVHPGDKTATLFLDRANKFLANEKKSFLTSL